MQQQQNSLTVADSRYPISSTSRKYQVSNILSIINALLRCTATLVRWLYSRRSLLHYLTATATATSLSALSGLARGRCLGLWTCWLLRQSGVTFRALINLIDRSTWPYIFHLFARFWLKFIKSSSFRFQLLSRIHGMLRLYRWCLSFFRFRLAVGNRVIFPPHIQITTCIAPGCEVLAGSYGVDWLVG